MRTLFIGFSSRDDGAVVVDWIVLSAAIIGLGVPMMMMFGLGTNTLADQVGDSVAETRAGYAGSE